MYKSAHSSIASSIFSQNIILHMLNEFCSYQKLTMKIKSVTLATLAPQIRAFSSASASIIQSQSLYPSLSVRSYSYSSSLDNVTQSAHDLLTSGDGKLSLHYFSIEGVGEQVRIALSSAGIPFEDIRVPLFQSGKRRSQPPSTVSYPR